MAQNETTLLTPTEAAKILRVGRSTVYRIVGLDWVEMQATGERPIRRVTEDSVRKLLERRRGQ